MDGERELAEDPYTTGCGPDRDETTPGVDDGRGEHDARACVDIGRTTNGLGKSAMARKRGGTKRETRSEAGSTRWTVAHAEHASVRVPAQRGSIRVRHASSPLTDTRKTSQNLLLQSGKKNSVD
jgi:hypothetical protein